ncbi:MAG: DUF4307 domain-containing protein [Nocardioidaceae bacterium]
MTDLATRYPARRAGRHLLLVVGSGLLAAVFLGWLVWVMLSHGRPEVTSDMVSFEVVDEHRATATFTVVRRTPEVRASCLLRAQSADHAVVGEVNLEVGPGGRETTTLVETVRTEREATTVDVVGCVADGQPQRR